ncbi:MAG: hypothetical protein PHY30_02650 [Candidatus Pacebacteria bacterium]|nr:hypothetical protein [Candidatus Paceibacterota bacterium]
MRNGTIAISSPEGLQFAKERNFSTVVKDKRFSGCNFVATAHELGLTPIGFSPERDVLCVLKEYKKEVQNF